jgi:integrase
VWISLAHNGTFGHQLRTDAIADVCKRRLGSSKVHLLRHSFAWQMHQVGAPVTAIQAQLGHKNVATTQRYLGKLDATRNPFGRSLVERFGGRRVTQPAES